MATISSADMTPSAPEKFLALPSRSPPPPALIGIASKRRRGERAGPKSVSCTVRFYFCDALVHMQKDVMKDVPRFGRPLCYTVHTSRHLDTDDHRFAPSSSSVVARIMRVPARALASLHTPIVSRTLETECQLQQVEPQVSRATDSLHFLVFTSRRTRHMITPCHTEPWERS
jgi:hypothetical protein